MLKKAIRICPVCNKLFLVMVDQNEKRVSNHYAKSIYPLQSTIRKKGCICCSMQCSKAFNRVRRYLNEKERTK